jgi:PEP-CTERM motif
MFSAIRNAAIGAAALGLCAGVAVPTQAAYVVSLQQVGGNVVATGSGNIDLTDLSLASGSFGQNSVIFPSEGAIAVGSPLLVPVTVYNGITTGPASFGSGFVTVATSGGGDTVGLGDAFNRIVVPVGYVSGTPLGTSTDTWSGATFVSLGATPGTYTWTWGTGANADSFTLQIGAVPEPASLSVLALGLAGLGMVLRTRRV